MPLICTKVFATLPRSNSHLQQVVLRFFCEGQSGLNTPEAALHRKVGGAGSAVNLSGDAKTLKVTSGEDKITIYNAKIRDDEGKVVKVSPGRRRFCKVCGSALWVDDPRWPELVHPFATAIDTTLPRPPEKTHVMLGSKASWIDLDHTAYNDQKYDTYSEESIAQWHQRLNLEDPQ